MNVERVLCKHTDPEIEVVVTQTVNGITTTRVCMSCKKPVK